MEAAKNSSQDAVLPEEKAKKKSFLQKFVKFLMYGGFLLFIVLGVIIYILISGS